MKDLMIVITISYFALYGAMEIVNNPMQAKAEEVQSQDFCGLEDVFCYGDPVQTPVEANIRPVQTFSNQKDILHQVCADKGFKDDFCERDLYGIMMAESRGNCEVIGDQGRSYGCFQIQVKMHNVSIEHAKDLEWAANWTLERMQRFGYPIFRSLAIRRHNGFGVSTFSYLDTVNSYTK